MPLYDTTKQVSNVNTERFVAVVTQNNIISQLCNSDRTGFQIQCKCSCTSYSPFQTYSV